MAGGMRETERERKKERETGVSQNRTRVYNSPGLRKDVNVNSITIGGERNETGYTGTPGISARWTAFGIGCILQSFSSVYRVHM